jgi:hypothetical protein
MATSVFFNKAIILPGNVHIYRKSGIGAAACPDLPERTALPLDRALCRTGVDFTNPGADPTIASYNASTVKFYYSASSLVRFENNNVFFLYEKRSSLSRSIRSRSRSYDREFQRQRCKNLLSHE